VGKNPRFLDTTVERGQKSAFFGHDLDNVGKIQENVNMSMSAVIGAGESVPLMPPGLGKIESLLILRKEASARQALAELKGFAHTMPNPYILINTIGISEAKESSAIENIITTQDELYKALASNLTAADPAAKEVLNYRQAVYKGFNIIRQTGMIRISDIVKIQELIIGNNAGIRKLPGTSLVNSATDDVVYTPPQDYDTICALLNNFCAYLNDAEDSLWKMAVLHYQFETIHPFYDGNGRTGRILNILYLLLKQHLDTPILYLSSFIIKRKSDYYSLLSRTRTSGMWEDWVLFMLDGIEQTAKLTLEKVRAIKELFDLTTERVKAHCPKIYSRELVELIFEHPYSKIDFVVNKINVNRKTASKYLKELETCQILSSTRLGKETLYIHKALMRILEE
jgi:Fic family protein